MDPDFVHPEDPDLKYPFVKNLLKDPEILLHKLFLEFFEGKQDWDEDKNILYRPYLDNYEIDSVSCHFTEHVRAKCRSNDKPRYLDGWRSLDPSIIRSYPVIDDIREYIRKTFRAQECNLFNPALCIRLYMQYNDMRSPIKIIDPSAGWGDRMLSAIACGDYVSQYDCYDPNKNLIEPYHQIMSRLDKNNKCRFFCEEFQKADLPKGYYDLGLTSPPYFNLETYSDDPTQSVNTKTSTYYDWRDQFYYYYLKNLVYSIRSGGKIIIYVSDFLDKNKNKIELEKDTINILERKIGGVKLITRGEFRASKRNDPPPRFPKPFFVFSVL